MQKQHGIWIGIIVAAFCASLALAQEKSESVESILKELDGYQAVEATPAAPIVAVEAMPEPVAKEIAPMAEVEEIAALEEPKKEKKKEVTVLRERDRFETVKIKGAKPRQAERERRRAETDALKKVERSWNGMVFRDYALSSDAVEALGASEATEAVDVRKEFPEVKFPKGAYAMYRPGLNRLFVQNTRTNMERFEALMAALDAPREGEAGQVKIEARFVEFSEGALEELGFEWSSPDAIDLSGDVTIDDLASREVGGPGLFANAIRSVPYAQPGSLGGLGTGVGGALALGELAPGGDWNNVPNSGNWRAGRMEDAFGDTAATMNLGLDFGDRFDLIISAIDQTSGIDVLSAPSIVTLSGEEATITVGERHYYPEVYEEGVSDGTVLHIRYEDFYPKILGVEMAVTPIINGDSIQLEINPKITDLIGWEQFVTAPKDSSHNYYQAVIRNQYGHEAVVAKLPIFKRREIKTEVSISSGSTVALGGLISEKLEAFDDRVPVLGSMPLVGRLFRSEGERTVKKNLTIFLTATKVEPNGRVVAGSNYE